jgi:hypothetical protein
VKGWFTRDGHPSSLAKDGCISRQAQSLIRFALRYAAVAFPSYDFQRANSACQLSKAGAAYRRPLNQAADGLVRATTKNFS